MTYSPTIPGPNDLLSQSQQDIQVNFAQANTLFGLNHVPFDDGVVGDRGKHKKITFPIPIGGTASEINSTPVAGTNQLFFNNTVVNRQLTNLPLVTATAGASGYGIVTPWGLIINWGITGAVGPGGATIKFQVPFVTSIDSITCTANNTGSSVVTVSNATNINFKCFSSNVNAVYFFAIGH